MAMKADPGFVQADPAIKQEPGMQGNVHPGYNPTNGARPTAAQRAALALESQFGHRAAASINAIHSGMVPQQQLNAAGQPQPQQGQRPGQVPQHMNPQQHQQHMNPQQHQQHMNPQQQQQQQHVNPQHQQQHMNPQHQQQQYRQGVAAAIQQRMQQIPRPGPPNGLPAAQHDGPSDAVERGAESDHPAAMDRAQIDQYLHAQIAERAKQMEGGGLMLPLKEATKSRGVAKKRGDADGPAQLDGPDDDVKSEEDDEDAINSDLDDPDELGADDDDDEDEMGHMMLCMYDKVQRVKNKWYVHPYPVPGPYFTNSLYRKCVLKDGVLTVNGKEYVFHKATGEYEW
jgi:transcription initiation factor TFIIA large subunit